LVAAVLLSALLTLPTVIRADEAIRFGVYLNPPLSFPDRDGKPGGFIVDLMDYIASREEWRIEYVPCTWKQCNELLERGEISMLSPIAVTDARERRLDFNRESLYVNWGQLLTAEGGDGVESPLDLAGKSIIALAGDIHFADLKLLAKRYDIDVRFFEVNDYEDVLAWVADGPVDAGLVNRSFDIDRFPQFRLEKSPVIFNPAEIRIALSPKNGQLQNALRIQRLDRHLTQLKGNKNSIYYELQKRWFGERLADKIPTWVFWLLLAIASIALVLAMGVLFLRRQVRHQTRKIREISDRFTAFMTHLPGIAYMKGADGRYLFVNPIWEQTKHLSSAEVVGRLPEDIWPTHDLDNHVPEEQDAIEQGRAVENIETSPWDDHARYWRLIRFPIDEDSGNVMVGGIGLDVTTRRETEEQLSRLNRQLQLLLESAGEGIFGLDGLGRCNFINQAALDLLGYERKEVIGNNMHDLIQHSRTDSSAYPGAESPIHRAIKDGSKSRIRNEVFWHAGGNCFPVEYSVHPIAEGEYPGAVVVFHRLKKVPA